MAANGAFPPGPRFLTPFGAVAASRPDPLGFLRHAFREYGDIVCTRVGPWRSYLVFHPDDVKHVLQDNNQNYVKGFLIAKTKVLIGEGLFTSEKSFWRRQRRLAQPAFHRQRIAGFADIMRDAATRTLDGWATRVGRAEPFDVAADMSQFTLRVVGQALFRMDLTGEAAAFGQNLLTALECVNHRVMTFPGIPTFIPTPRNLRLRRAIAALDRVVYQIIETRRRSAADDGDFLSMMLHTRDEDTGETMDDRQLRDEVMTFLLAGHETTAVALSWTWYLLATHPAVEAKVAAEVATVLGGRAPGVEHLTALPYTRMVVEEAMRLYPPLWGFGRQTIAPDRLGGYDIPANSIVSLAPFITHRHPAVWDDPERFDPERFAPERAAGRPRFAYFPFSGGPRLCIGIDFALMEAQLMVAMTMQRYRLRLVPGGPPVEPEVRLTLRPRGGLPMTLDLR